MRSRNEQLEHVVLQHVSQGAGALGVAGAGAYTEGPRPIVICTLST